MFQAKKFRNFKLSYLVRRPLINTELFEIRYLCVSPQGNIIKGCKVTDKEFKLSNLILLIGQDL